LCELFHTALLIDILSSWRRRPRYCAEALSSSPLRYACDEPVALLLMANFFPRHISGLFVAALLGGGVLDGHARDYGQYSDRPGHLRDWFKRLKNPRTGLPCCEEADCARTEARTRGSGWEARAPDGSWIAIPPESMVTDQGNPTGEPILCSYMSFEGNWWDVYCFVPGPSS
jgi:hypothetical protein